MAEEGEDTTEPLKYKTWILKVSIHCEGCKRKVKRILHSTNGVYNVDVDAKQQRVTVSGNVDSNTLIRKLEKSGKHAELLPVPQTQTNNKSNKKTHPTEQQAQDSVNQQSQPAFDNTAQKAHGNAQPEPCINNNSSSSNKGNIGNGNKGQQQQPQVKEVKVEGKTPGAGDDEKSPENAISSGVGKKKKKKKGNNGDVDGASEQQVQGANGGPASTESQRPPQQSPDPPENMSLPRHFQNNRECEYPPVCHALPPVYAVSYNTAFPSSGYTASYYSAPPPDAYAYVHHGADVWPPPPSDWNSYPAQPSDSFQMFSDENPNACSVM